MGRIALLVLILISAVGSGYAEETSVAGGTSTRCGSCVAPNQAEEPLMSPAIRSSSVFVLAGGASGGFFPVLPRGQRQFESESSKLRGQRFRWHAP